MEKKEDIIKNDQINVDNTNLKTNEDMRKDIDDLLLEKTQPMLQRYSWHSSSSSDS